MKSYSSSSHVIRGENIEIDGVIFCSNSGQLEKDNPNQKQERDSLKSLENYWRQKGVQEGKQQGFKEGFAEGEKEGLAKGFVKGEQEGRLKEREELEEESLKKGQEQAAKEVEFQLNLLKEIAQDFENQHESMIIKGKSELIKMFFAISRKVLFRELEATSTFESVLENILNMSRSITKNLPIEIYLTPSDYNNLAPHFPQLTKKYTWTESIEFIEDSNLPEHSWRIESPVGLLRVNLDWLLSELEEKIVDQVHRSQLDFSKEDLGALLTEDSLLLEAINKKTSEDNDSSNTTT